MRNGKPGNPHNEIVRLKPADKFARETSMNQFTTSLVCALGFAASCMSLAQGTITATGRYPDKPIRLVVPYAVGGGGDVVFRAIIDPLAGRLGQPIYLDYKPGAGGTIGLEALARSLPDGYTIGVGSSDAVALAPNFYPKLGYKPSTELQPIAIVAEMPLVLLVKADSPIASFKDMLEKARVSPGSITYGTPGRGSSPHLMGELLAKASGVELTHVPYKGTGPALVDLFGGHVSAVIASGFDSVPLEKAGRVRTLAVTGTSRYSLLPQTPTVNEQGIDAVDELKVWFGIFAPAGFPAPALDRLSREIDAIVRKGDFNNRAAELGFVPIRATPEQFATRMKIDSDRLATMVRRTGVKPD
ncbi:MAG: hypothetical protein JWQ07_4225 [Ramlibacter sp.]|nr:hypothetical protein [Ramlibacter sp.]